MGAMLETVVVGAVVAVALVWAARAGWRSVKKQGTCSSCGSSGNCPIAKNPDALAELSQQGRLDHLDNRQPGAPSCQELAEALEKKSPTDPRQSGIT